MKIYGKVFDLPILLIDGDWTLKGTSVKSQYAKSFFPMLYNAFKKEMLIAGTEVIGVDMHDNGRTVFPVMNQNFISKIANSHINAKTLAVLLFLKDPISDETGWEIGDNCAYFNWNQHDFDLITGAIICGYISDTILILKTIDGTLIECKKANVILVTEEEE